MNGVKDGPRRLALATAAATAVALLVTGCASAARPDSTQSRSTAASLTPSPTGSSARGGDVPDAQGRASIQSTPVAPPKPPPVNYCKNNKTAQAVLVSITSQHAWMCERGRTVYSTAVTTGMNHANTHTPTGRFTIQGRNRDTVLNQSNGDKYYVKYWIPFSAPLYGFHDSSWQHFPYGSAQYKSDGSHGCVHLPLAAMKYLYNWVHLGASVDIHV